MTPQFPRFKFLNFFFFLATDQLCRDIADLSGLSQVVRPLSHPVATLGQANPVTTRIFLSRQRLFPPWPNYVVTSNLVVTQDQMNPIATENYVATKALQPACKPCHDTEGHVATLAPLCRARALLCVRILAAHARPPCVPRVSVTEHTSIAMRVDLSRLGLPCRDPVLKISVATKNHKWAVVLSLCFHFSSIHFIKYYCFCTTCINSIKSRKLSTPY